MSDDKKPEVKPEVDPPVLGNDLANRSRADITARFDEASLKAPEPSVESSEKDPSKTDEETKKKESEPVHNPDKTVSKDTEKPTSEPKGKDDKVDDGGQKTVPLQALQESRERFKKLNLEYRDFKNSNTQEMTSLKEELNKLKQLIQNTDKTSIDDPASDEDPEKIKLRQQLADLQAKSKDTTVSDQQKAALKLQENHNTKIAKTTEELDKEGYQGFEYGLNATGKELRKMLIEGEITQAEENDPEMWKKVFKEQVYEKMQSKIVKQDRTDLMESKKEAKRKANLVSDPGKAPQKKEKKDETPQTFAEFNKSVIAERVEATRRKL